MSRDRVPVRDDLADVDPYGAPQLDVPVRLNTNETPYPPPPAFVEELARRLRDLQLHRYPDRRAWALRTALGQRFDVSPARVWAANGSNEVLLQLFQAYGGPGRQVLLASPGYSAHPLIARVTATATTSFALDADLRLDVAGALRCAEEVDPDLVCLASPNNPTGIAVPLDAVQALHEATRALVILDEAYVEFGGTSAVSLLDALPRVVVVRTFSKAFRLAGIRLGYLLAHDWVIDDLRRVRLPYHLDAMTQEAGVLACELAAEVTAHITDVVAERERVRQGLEDLGLTVFPSVANFLLFRVADRSVFDRLLDRGVLIRDFSSAPRLEGCLRVTIGTAAENDRFLTALKESL